MNVRFIKSYYNKTKKDKEGRDIVQEETYPMYTFKAEKNYYLALYKKSLLMTGQSNTKRATLVCFSSKRPKTAFPGPLVPLCRVLEIFPSVSDVRQS